MPQVTRDEYLEINEVPLATPAWEFTDYSGLWEGPDVRGGDRLLPGTAGVKAYRRRPTVTRRIVPGVIYGTHDQEGEPAVDKRAQLWANVAYLRENVSDPLDEGDGTRPAVMYLPGGLELAGDVHVIGMDLGKLAGDALLATLELSIPLGSLLLTGS